MALLELIALSFLIGVVPPLRQVWYVTAGLGAVLLLYIWVLLSTKARSTPIRRTVTAPAPMQPMAAASFAVAAAPADDGVYDFEDDAVHVVVREASVGV